MNENKLPWYKRKDIMACFHTAFCPIFLIVAYIIIVLSVFNSNESDFDKGYELMVLFIVAFIVLMITVLASVPFILTLNAVLSHKNVFKTARITLPIADLLWAIIIWILNDMSGLDVSLSVVLFIAYVVDSIILIIKLKQSFNDIPA